MTVIGADNLQRDYTLIPGYVTTSGKELSGMTVRCSVICRVIPPTMTFKFGTGKVSS